MSDPSIGADGHIPDANGRSRQPTAGLREQHAGWHSSHLTRRLQSALNAAAGLIFHLRHSDHVTDALVSLHWLRVPEQIQFKIAVLTYRVLHGDAPRYLGPFNLYC